MTSPTGPRPERLEIGRIVTHLPADGPDRAARELLDAGSSAREAAHAVPSSSLAWALLAEESLATDAVASYAYARTGYHRGLDALRRAGWRGAGEVPLTHAPNEGFLRALAALARAARAIGEDDEAERCTGFVRDCGVDPAALDALASA